MYNDLTETENTTEGYNMKTLTITQAAALIAQAVMNGSATLDEVTEMQKVIRAKTTFGGKTMNNAGRYNMMVFCM